MRAFPFFVNFGCALFYGFTIYFDYLRTEEYFHVLPIPTNFWSKLVWLTIVNLGIQFVYHIIGSYLALTSTSKNKSGKNKKSEDSLLKIFHFCATSVVFPLAVTVVILFWGLVFFDPDLLLTEEAKLMLSVAWYNHALHSVPLLAMLLDFFAWHHPQPEISDALKAIVSFVVFYMFDIHFVYFYTGKWAYPILSELAGVERVIFYGCCIGVFFVNFLLGYALNKYIGPLPRKAPMPRKKKH